MAEHSAMPSASAMLEHSAEPSASAMIEHSAAPSVAAPVSTGTFHAVDGTAKGTGGMQDFVVPASADTMTYHTIVLWDTAMTHAIAAAPLQ
jgi:hypothetical protein